MSEAAYIPGPKIGLPVLACAAIADGCAIFANGRLVLPHQAGTYPIQTVMALCRAGDIRWAIPKETT